VPIDRAYNSIEPGRHCLLTPQLFQGSPRFYALQTGIVLFVVRLVLWESILGLRDELVVDNLERAKKSKSESRLDRWEASMS
jgi:hypothetical protein